MLELKDIRWKLPEGEEILKGIDLCIPDGKLTVITGPNGGGKTSLAKIIAGLYEPAQGNIILDGEDITEWDITKRAKGGIAYAFQQPVRFKGLTVRDLLEMSAETKKRWIPLWRASSSSSECTPQPATIITSAPSST